jgi:hypothetical protein
MMSATASAECWTPSPRWSSANTLICDSLKNGRNGSLLANFTPDCGSHITTDFRPEPCVAGRRATSLVWNAISQNRSKPITCSIHSSAGFMVWKFDVRWSMRWKPKAVAASGGPRRRRHEPREQRR